MKFRDLRSDEIEVRVQECNKYGVSLLLYKNARVDMAILDETVGAEHWQREHYDCKGNLFCRVGIKCGGEWIWKSDCGAESKTEAQKGEASDSFKRACSNWGIGRALYTAPRIFVRNTHCQLKEGKQQGKLVCNDRFSVEKIAFKDGVIVGLSIINEEIAGYKPQDKRCFFWQMPGARA